jgi:hypothetical protein
VADEDTVVCVCVCVCVCGTVQYIYYLMIHHMGFASLQIDRETGKTPKKQNKRLGKRPLQESY